MHLEEEKIVLLPGRGEAGCAAVRSDGRRCDQGRFEGRSRRDGHPQAASQRDDDNEESDRDDRRGSHRTLTLAAARSSSYKTKVQRRPVSDSALQRTRSSGVTDYPRHHFDQFATITAPLHCDTSILARRPT